MWTFAAFYLLSPVYCLDSNVIRSSKEVMDPQQVLVNTQRGTVVSDTHNAVYGRVSAGEGASETSVCDGQDCPPTEVNPPNLPTQVNKCSSPGKTERNTSNQQRPTPSEEHTHTHTHRAQEMAPCVRSRDCAAALCCARYLTGKRCQRVPLHGEACLLRGRAKRRRANPERCECGAGLACRPHDGAPRGQGVCQHRTRNGRRATRHSHTTCHGRM